MRQCVTTAGQYSVTAAIFGINLKCTNLTIKLYNYLSFTDDLWLCSCCRNSNTSCLCSDFIAETRLAYLPRLDLIPFQIYLNEKMHCIKSSGL